MYPSKRPATSAAPSGPTLWSLSDQLESQEDDIQNLKMQIATLRQESSESLKEVTRLSSLVESQGGIARLDQQQLGDEKNESKVKVTPAKEKTFVLKHSLKNVSTFPEGHHSACGFQNFYGANWGIRIKRENHRLGVFLVCDRHMEETMSARHTARLMKLGKVVMESSMALDCLHDGTIAGHDTFLIWRYVEEAAVKDEIFVEIEVKLSHTTCRVPGKTRNFDEDRKQYSDVVLTVGGENFHVLKKFLASKSDFFQSMFFGPFVEAKMDPIPLGNIDPMDFLGFLEVLHGEQYFNDSNVEGIADLGHFHLAPSVLTSCEKFLLFESKLPLKTKFRLGTKYGLKSLIEKLISEVNNVEEIKSVLREQCLKPLG